MSSQKVTVYVSSNFTLNRRGADPIKFTAGRNLIDADVAEHPYVKAHLTDAVIGEVNNSMNVAFQAAQTRIAELEAIVKEKDDAMAAMAEAYASQQTTKPKK